MKGDHGDKSIKMKHITSKFSTPQKFNMESEKKSLEKENSSWKPSFSGSMLNFGGVAQNSNIVLETHHILLMEEIRPTS